MISFLQPLPIGNACRVLLAPLAGAVASRVLRKLTDDFAGPTDPAAGVVYEGDEKFFIDIAFLNNGTVYYYQAYDLVADVWVASGGSVAATPASTGLLRGPDPIELICARFEAALKADVAAGRLVHARGYVPCLKAPPSLDGVEWPVVTVHLKSNSPVARGLGEMVADDVYDAGIGEWTSSEGWLANWNIEIWAWSLNADGRIALRKALERAVLGNLPIFEQAAMSLITATWADLEDMESYNAPVYNTVCSFGCQAPIIVDAQDPAIAGVDVSVDAD